MKIKFLLITFIVLTVASCVKAPKVDPNLPELEFKIPDNFDWKTIKEVKVTVNVTAVDAQSKDKLHSIKIYNSPLLNSGALIASGAATPNKPFDVALTVASIIDKLYIYEMKPNGLVTVITQEISSPSLSVKLQNESADLLTKSNSFTTSNVMNPAPIVPLPTNYDVTVNNQSALTLTGFPSGTISTHGNTYKSYYIPQGFNRTETIDFGNWISHSVLYVKGTLSINSDVSMDKCSIVILDGGSVTFKTLINGGGYTWPIPFIYIQDGGTLNISNNMDLYNVTVVNKGALVGSNDDIHLSGGSIMYNEGSITITKNEKNLSITNNSALYNSGTIDVPNIDFTSNSLLNNDLSGIITSKEFYFTNGTVITNHGEITSTVKFYNSGGGTLNNFCRITAQITDFQSLTANLKEGSLLNTQSFKVNFSTFNMDGASMLLMGKMEVNPYSFKFISTSPSFALIKNTGDMPDLRWAAAEIKGNIEFVHTNLVNGSGANGKDLYLASFKDGAILSKEQTKNIAGTSCNQSLGQIIPDEPVGPDPEFATYFPSQSGWGTYAFEDQWPIKGDYDLNDLVVLFRVTSITNSSNQITKLHLDYNLIAAGAIKQLSAGFQLDNAMASNIKSVTGQLLGGGAPFTSGASGVETGVTKAIIPLFNGTKAVVTYSGFLNTVSGEHTSTPEKRVTVEFNNPVNQSDITMGSFNFFIVADSRGKEIHIPGYLATEKFNSASISGGSLHPSDNFKTTDGMMWGLMFPEGFSYPSEKNSIIDAYTHFAAWATSGGTQYPDWYKNIAGYRNQELIY